MTPRLLCVALAALTASGMFVAVPSAGTQATEPYPDLIADGDLVVYKTTFSAVLSSDLPAQLRARGIDTVVVGGLTTPIWVTLSPFEDRHDGYDVSGAC